MPRTLTAAERARNAYMHARRRHDPEQADEALRDLAAAKIAAFITKTLADAPPLGEERAARLRSLIPATAANGRAN